MAITRVDVSYIGYSGACQRPAATGPKIWSFTADNLHAAEFRLLGAAQSSPPWSPIRAICWARARWIRRDAARRATVMDNYEKGEVTQADKRTPTRRSSSPPVPRRSDSNAQWTER